LLALAKLGVNPELLVHSPADRFKASFCSGYFFPCNQGDLKTHVYAPKCGRTLLKSGVSLRPDWDNKQAILELLGSLIGRMRDYAHVPIMRTYF